MKIVKGNLTKSSNIFLEPVKWFCCPTITLFFLQFSAPKSYQSEGAWQKLSPNHDFTFMVIISTFEFVVGVPILSKNAKIVNR